MSAPPDAPPPARWRVVVDWCFRSRVDGTITIVQVPNLPLVLFIVASVVGRVLDAAGRSTRVVDGAGLVALAWWALDEVVRGVNPWRRALGLAGCGAALSGALALLG